MDIRILVACALLVQVGCAVGMVLVARSVPGFQSLRSWAGAYVLLGAALLLGMRDLMLAGRCCALTGAILLTHGVAAHFAPRACARALRWGMALLAGFVGVTIGTRGWPVGPDVSLVAFTLAFAAALLPGAWLAHARTELRPEDGDQAGREAADRAPRRALSAMLATLAFLTLLRGLLGPWRGAVLNPFTPDVARASGFALYLICAAAMAFVFVWVVAAHMRRQFEVESLTDALTGVLNRRALDAILARELASCAASGSSLALLVIDMDLFKQINDDHGHPAGDRLLAVAAQSMASALRSGDTLARYGGEEFVALLPGRDLHQAEAVGERLRVRVAALDLPWERVHLRATASVGVAAWTPGDSPDSLLGRADRNLYAAKHLGRNRVCSEVLTAAVQV